ncbi:MAG: hypothetical protein ABIQ73_01375 [Acidimicrobiales bacterium]
MPNNEYYTGGSQSATGPAFLGLGEKQDEAAGFLVPSTGDVLLGSFDLALWWRGGANELDVYLVAERQRTPTNGTEPYEPDDTAVVERWRLTNIPTQLAATGNVVHVESAVHPRITANTRNWVYISVPQDDSAVAWMSSQLGYDGPGWRAERNSVIGFEWKVFANAGPALRITALS